MSNKTRLFSQEDGTTFWEDIKAFFAGIPPYILSLLGQLKDLAEPIVEQAVEIGNGIHSIIEEGTFTGNIIDMLVNSTANDIDNKVLDWLRENWGNVLYQIEGIPDVLQDVELATEEYFETLSGFSYPVRNAIIAKTVSEITRQYSNDQLGKSLSESDADYMVQAFYVDKYKGSINV